MFELHYYKNNKDSYYQGQPRVDMIYDGADSLKLFVRLHSTLVALFKWIRTYNFGRCCLFYKFLNRCLLLCFRTFIGVHIN